MFGGSKYEREGLNSGFPDAVRLNRVVFLFALACCGEVEPGVYMT